jgi:hypothetical protein
MHWPNLTFSFDISPFDWKRFQIGHPWQRHQPDAVWLIVGPLGIGAHWGG